MSLASKFIKTIWSGWIFDNYKTLIGLAAIALTKSGLFPDVDLADGMSIDEAILIWGVLDGKLKEYKIRKAK